MEDLLEQPYILNDGVTIAEVLAAGGGGVKDAGLTLTQFVRWTPGGS